jgi:hypothetical protein
MEGELMKISLFLMLAILAVSTIETSCRAKTTDTTHVLETSPAAMLKPAEKVYSGIVVETMNTAGYTYVQIDTGKEKVWAAAPEFKVKVGDKVNFPMGSKMVNYQSKTLNRSFDAVYFVTKVTVEGEEQGLDQLPPSHPAINSSGSAGQPAAEIDFSGIKKPEGGTTVSEIYAKKNELAGKEVSIRGKVIKFNANIMGKNWIHIRDGSGVEGTNDLTVTTNIVLKVGDTVLVKGIVVLDKDFGSGYSYKIIIEDAKVTVE